METRKKLRGIILLLFTAMIWGSAFVAQSIGSTVGTFTFNASRSILAAFALLVCIFLFKLGKPCKSKAELRELIIGGISCGILLFAASAFQQAGISETGAGKSGFITALYIVIVPLLGIFMKRRAGVLIWLSVVLAAAGMYLLCMTSEKFSLNRGDLLLLCCAVVFSMHILVIDYFTAKTDPVRMSCLQFFTCALLNGICIIFFESPSLSVISQNWFSIVYAGIFSSAIAYTLQMIAQRDTEPVIASLLMSLESVFAAFSGWIFLHESLSRRELIGCALIFIAVISAQLPTPDF